MAPSTASTSLTGRDLDIVARARELAAAMTTDELASLAGIAPDLPGDMIRAEALGVARYLLDELADLAERLGAAAMSEPGASI